MIRRVIIEGFKRFDRIEFALPGHIVLTGPNNTGKTTILQAIAAWSLALERWKELNDFQRHGGAYARAPIARQAFSAVPLRAFDLLWRGREYTGSICITIRTDDWSLRMDFEADSTEQIYVRPEPMTPKVVKAIDLTTVLVPPMTGLSTDEPVYMRPKLDQLLGQARPGEMLRNLLLEANRSEAAWPRLQDAIERLFCYTLLPPDGRGAHIVAEYRIGQSRPLDIASAGSGFQQALMLLAILNTRPGSVLLLDEPDAHLHVILQDAIFAELRSAAARTGSQLIVATHSEVIINAVDARELCVLLDRPRMLADEAERERLRDALRVLSNEDILRALEAPGVLYLEGHTDLDILRAFARVLNHPASALLETRLFWKRSVAEAPGAGAGVKAREHYGALCLVREIPALQVVDGDSLPDVRGTAITGHGFQRTRWHRYEIESYLVHPDALARFVRRMVGEASAGPHVDDLTKYLRGNLPPAVIEHPLADHAYLNNTKARTDILPPALNAAGLPNLPYTRYHELAAGMLPEEIHPEVREKLDAIVEALRS
jgi:ABC-type cobalamin/Fe3+-siderophores transport system ATPase subunit